jgi:hypothetical protein
MKKLVLLLSLILPALAQQTKILPDCTLGPNAVSFTAIGNSVAFDNRPVSSNSGIPCTNWTLVWSAEPVVTSLTIKIEAAPDNNGTPGSFTAIASGSTFPSGKVNIATSTGYYPWLRVSVTAIGSSGAITGILNGWRDNADTIGGGGGGGGGGCTAPCVVIGPAGTGSPSGGAPVQIAGTDSADNIITPTFCNASVPITVSSSGLTQILALSGSTSIRICNISVAFASGVNFQLETGTGSNCAGSTTALTGVFQSILTVALDFNSGTLNGPAGQALCINLGSGVTGGGVLNYARY